MSIRLFGGAGSPGCPTARHGPNKMDEVCRSPAGRLKIRRRLKACPTISCTLAIAFASCAQAAPDGEMIFLTKCATCHVATSDHVPSREALSRTSRATILASLESGRMRIQGDGLTFAE